MMKPEYIFFINFIINLFNLKTCALLLKNNGRLFVLSAFVGSCFAIVLQVYALSKVGQVLLQAGLVIWYVCLSFKFSSFKKFCQIYVCYLVTTFVYGGACFYLCSLLQVRSLLLLLSVVCVVFFAICFLAKKVHRKQAVENFCYTIKIENNGKQGEFKAFLDSGNLLFDPVTQSPVNLINFRMFSWLFKDIELEDILRHSNKIKSLAFAHYINFGTLTSSDKILVFQVDKVTISGKIFDKVTFGLVLKNFDRAFGTDIILHNNFANLGEVNV